MKLNIIAIIRDKHVKGGLKHYKRVGFIRLNKKYENDLPF